MKLCTALGLSATLLGMPIGFITAQPPAPAGQEQQQSPFDLFKQAVGEIQLGRFDVAAETLKKFVAANPTDKDYLEITKNEPTAFVKLRNIPVWSDNQQAQADALKAVEEIITKSEAAVKKQSQDPATVAKFVRNLGATLEERIYAEEQLRRAGDAAAPALIDALRTSTDANTRAGIAGMMTKLNIDQLPGIVAATAGVSNDDKLLIIRSLAARPDIVSLLASGDTDITPHLWYYASTKSQELEELRSFSKSTLDALTGGTASKRFPSEELVKLALPFVEKKGRFRSGDKVKLWNWYESKLAIEPVDLTATQAGDYFGIRNLRWAIERNPSDVVAQELFLSLTVSRAVEAGAFGELAQTDPNLYQVLASAPFDLLSSLLNRSMSAQNTSLSFGLAAALAKRGDRPAAEINADGKPGVLLRALDYPDTRVQLAAAVGIIHAGTINHGRHAKIVDVLRRVASSDTTVQADKEVGKALIVDPVDLRGDRLAAGLRLMGYTVERFSTGRELAQRLNRAADADLVFIDRHVQNPTLPDLFPMLGNTVDGRPVFLVASTDKIKAVPLELQLLRLAAIIGVTETSSIEVPQPFRFDPRVPLQEENITAARLKTAQIRDLRLKALYDIRLERLKRLIAGSGLPLSAGLQARLELRLPQLTSAILAAEYPITLESSPESYRLFESRNKLIKNNPQLDDAVLGVPTEGISRLLEELEGTLDPARQKLLRDMLGRIDPVALGMEADVARDAAVERDLQRFVKGRRLDAAVIPETINPITLEADLKAAGLTPAQAPVNNAKKKKAALIAVEALRKLALNEVPGYDIRPAEAALRNAMKDDDLAAPAIDAVGRIPGATAQQDLLSFALTVGRKPELRVQAADRLTQHVQAHGKLIPANLMATLRDLSAKEENTEVRGRLAVVRSLLSDSPNDMADLIRAYPLPLPQPPKPVEKKEPEKKEPEKIEEKKN